MKALVITEYAHPSKIQLTQDAPEPVPKPGSDELLIDVYSAGLNFFDVRPPPFPPPPFYLPTTPSHAIDTAGPGKVPDAAAKAVRARRRVCRNRRGCASQKSVQTRRPRVWEFAGLICGAGRRQAGKRAAAAGCALV